MNPSYSFFVVIIFYLFELWEFLFFSGALDTRFLGEFGEGRASGHHMSTFSAAKAKSLLGTLLSFLGGEFLGEFDRVNIHGVWVSSGSGGRQGEGLESLGRPSTSLSDLLSTIPLVLEVSCLGVPFVDLIWNGIERHDPLHERGRDSGSEEADEHIVVRDAGMSGVALKC